MSKTYELGFTLMELLIAVAIICIIAAIAIPGLLRARVAANEASAIGSLRAVNSAQSGYAAGCGSGFFSPSLTNLATPPIGGGDGFISPGLGVDPAVKSGYVIALTPGVPAATAPASCNGAAAGTVVWTYFAGADPIANAGRRHFGVNQGGAVFESTAVVAVTQIGPPAGATPVQ